MKKLLVALMVLCMALVAGVAFAAPAAEKPGESGFAEIPIGEEQQVGPYNVAAVYFQAVDMYPAGKNPSKEDSDMHLEADIHLKPEDAVKYGFGNGDNIWPAYLTVKYEIIDKAGKTAMEGSFMPMNADDGPHYGANVKMLGAGTYDCDFYIDSPTRMNYGLHVDKETGVKGRLWEEPVHMHWVFEYVPRRW